MHVAEQRVGGEDTRQSQPMLPPALQTVAAIVAVRASTIHLDIASWLHWPARAVAQVILEERDSC